MDLPPWWSDSVLNLRARTSTCAESFRTSRTLTSYKMILGSADEEDSPPLYSPACSTLPPDPCDCESVTSYWNQGPESRPRTRAKPTESPVITTKARPTAKR